MWFPLAALGLRDGSGRAGYRGLSRLRIQDPFGAREQGGGLCEATAVKSDGVGATPSLGAVLEQHQKKRAANQRRYGAHRWLGAEEAEQQPGQ